MALSKAAVALKYGFRSGLEEDNADLLKKAGVRWAYEKLTLPYRVEETRKYTPDFLLMNNGIIVETKGRFVTADRKKLKLVKTQHPLLDIRLVFSNPNARLSKGSATTYGKWAADHGFPYAAKLIPLSWLTEAVNVPSLRYIEELLNGNNKRI